MAIGMGCFQSKYPSRYQEGSVEEGGTTNGGQAVHADHFRRIHECMWRSFGSKPATIEEASHVIDVVTGINVQMKRHLELLGQKQPVTADAS